MQIDASCYYDHQNCSDTNTNQEKRPSQASPLRPESSFFLFDVFFDSWEDTSECWSIHVAHFVTPNSAVFSSLLSSLWKLYGESPASQEYSKFFFEQTGGEAAAIRFSDVFGVRQAPLPARVLALLAHHAQLSVCRVDESNMLMREISHSELDAMCLAIPDKQAFFYLLATCSLVYKWNLPESLGLSLSRKMQQCIRAFAKHDTNGLENSRFERDNPISIHPMKNVYWPKDLVPFIKDCVEFVNNCVA